MRWDSLDGLPNHSLECCHSGARKVRYADERLDTSSDVDA